MKKIKLEILGMSYSQSQSGAYALILGEKGGQRRLPIIIGGFEAQSIAIGLENMKPSRPLTHDLMKNFARSYGIIITEVVIDKFVNGVFHSKLVCLHDGKITEIDSRTSDAVALSLRFKCPVYTSESIMSEAGIIVDQDQETFDEPIVDMTVEDDTESLSMKELEKKLEEAVKNENYELASRLRDEINERKGK